MFGDGSVLPGNDATQYVSILDGLSGRELTRLAMPTDYVSDGPLQCHFGVGYPDGARPSLVTKCKNRVGSGPFNLMIVAYDYRDGSLSQRWKYLRGNQGGAADYHRIRVVDVDQDGRDEVADGGYVVDDDGRYLYGIPGAIHGDQQSTIDPAVGYDAAVAHGASLALNGHSFRLPSVNELATLVDELSPTRAVIASSVGACAVLRSCRPLPVARPRSGHPRCW